MESSTISLIVTVAFMVALVVGLLRGFFKGAVKSLIDTFLGALAVALSFPVTRIILGALVNSKVLSYISYEIMEFLPSEASSYVDMIKAYLENPDSATLVGEVMELIAALPTIFVAPLIFLVVFVILALVLFGMGFFIKMFISSKKQKIGWRLFGAALGAFTYALVLTVLIIPANGYVNLVNGASIHLLEVAESNALPEDSENNAQNEEKSTDNGLEIDLSVIEPTLEVVVEYTSAINKNPVLTTIKYLGGRTIFNSLTTVKTSNTEISLATEIYGLIDLCDVAMKFANTNPENYGEEQAIATERASEILSSSEYIPELTSRVISFAAGELYAGRDLFGLEKPNLGDEFNPYLDRVLVILKDTDANGVRQDINTVSKIASQALESGVVENATSSSINVLDIVEDRKLFEAIFVELYKNPRTRNLIPCVMDYVTDYIYALYDDMNETSTDVPSFDYTEYDEERMYLEAAYVTEAIKEIKTFVNTVDITNNELDPKQIIMEADFGALGRGLEYMRDSIFTERVFEITIYAVLHSSLAEKLAIVDANLIEQANDKNADLEGMLTARQNIMKLALSIQEMENRDQTNLLIESVIESLLKEDTGTLAAIISKDNLEIMGMNEKQAESIEGIVTSIVHGAHGFEFESDEQKQAEIKKTEEIIFAISNTVLDEDREHHHMFEQDDGVGSTTEMTAQEFIDNIIDSSLTSSMIQNATRDENGEDVDDPYKLQGEISQSDIDEIANALNNTYAQDDVTEDEKKTLEALASIFGIKLQ